MHRSVCSAPPAPVDMPRFAEAAKVLHIKPRLLMPPPSVKLKRLKAGVTSRTSPSLFHLPQPSLIADFWPQHKLKLSFKGQYWTILYCSRIIFILHNWTMLYVRGSCYSFPKETICTLVKPCEHEVKQQIQNYRNGAHTLDPFFETQRPT